MNAFAERFVEPEKALCLERIVLLGKTHFQAAVREFVHHDHGEQPRQGLQIALITSQTTMIGTGPLKCRARLGRLLKLYYREAA